MGLRASLKQTNKQNKNKNKNVAVGQNQQVGHLISNPDQVQPHHFTDTWTEA